MQSHPFRRRDAFFAAQRARGGTTPFGPNMTPMVDVVLVILIFFMAATAFIGDEWFLRTTVQSARGHATSPDPFELPPVRLEIILEPGPAGVPETGTLATGLGLERAELDMVLTRLASFAETAGAREQIEVLIRPAASVPYADVVRVHEACEAAGIQTVALGELDD